MFSFFLATVMVGYMYEEVEKDDVVVGREREREKARERERDDIASFGRVEVDDLTNQREHILLSEEQSHNDGKT